MKQLFLTITFAHLLLLGCINAQSVNADKFEADIMQQEVQILDVRTAEEYAEGHIKNAMMANINNNEEFENRTNSLDKDKPVYVYCLAGARSERAANELRRKGFTNVVELKGGINAWRRANKPLEGTKKAKEMTPQEYQTMISSDYLVLVDFGAAWCPPCRKMQPVFESLQKDFMGKIVFTKVDAGAQAKLMTENKVNEIPTFILYRNGKEVWRAQGVIAKAEMEEKLRELSKE